MSRLNFLGNRIDSLPCLQIPGARVLGLESQFKVTLVIIPGGFAADTSRD